MTHKKQTEVLYETNIPIQGNEPFLYFRQAGMWASLHDYSRRTHTLVENFGGTISLASLRKGETLSLQLCRVSLVKMKWYERLRAWWAK